MSLKEKIQANLREALKAGNDLEVGVLRMLSAAVHNKEIEKRTKLFREKSAINSGKLEKESQLIDEEVIEVVSSEVKKRKDSIVEFEKGERADLVEKERKELEVLQKYMPEQLSEEEIKKLVEEAIKKVGASEPKDMGKVMGELMPKAKGCVDGSLVSKIVKDLLSSQ